MELLFKVLGLSQAWYNTEPWTLEAETEGSWIQGHSELHSETISNKQASKRKGRGGGQVIIVNVIITKRKHIMAITKG